MNQPIPKNIQLIRLHHQDEAFRAVMMLLAEDKDYKKIPLAAALGLLSPIRRQHYLLMVDGAEAVGCILWGEISQLTLDHCLAHKVEPTPDQLMDQGEALIALALVAKDPALVKTLWRDFTRLHAARPILAIRHFGKNAQTPKFIVIKDGRRLPESMPSAA